MREQAGRWQCTPGTVQRAYRELSRQGIVSSQPGQGTRVQSGFEQPVAGHLRCAELLHQAESFLFQSLSKGHTSEEIGLAMFDALDRWRAKVDEPEIAPRGALRFSGSHDPAISLIASHFETLAPGYRMNVKFTGSLGGLMALARHEADVAGCHLWDGASDSYNEATVRRVLQGERVTLLTLAYRRLGFLIPAGYPAKIAGLHDLLRARFVNRQRGAGTRVWLDAQLHRLNIDSNQISGYDVEEPTHSEIARQVADGRAEVGLGIEAAAQDYALDFIKLATEHYDLVFPEMTGAHPAIQALIAWLEGEEARTMFSDLGGYEVGESGTVRWVG